MKANSENFNFANETDDPFELLAIIFTARCVTTKNYAGFDIKVHLIVTLVTCQMRSERHFFLDFIFQ
jgi:hypothetical protein